MFKISNENPLRLIELFGGVGCQANGIKKAGIPFVHWGYVEFDKYPVKSYNAIWGTDFPTQDICNIHASDLHIEDTDKHTYLMTYSFPCTDLSVAGKGAGMAKGSGTRSGLLWEVERILNECDELPQILLMENVPQVHGKKNISDFNQWLEFLESKGYYNIWKDLNAKDYGIAQNRKRTFMISCLQPIDWYKWPDAIPLDTVMGDYLDDEVDKKFYVNNDRADNLVQKLIDDGELDEYIV